MGAGQLQNEVLGPNWQKTYTLPNPAPNTHSTAFARGGHIMRPTSFIAGEAGAERMTIAPLTKDLMSPHERRVERSMRRQEQYLERVAKACEDADGDLYIDGKKVTDIVTGHQLRDTRRERVAGGVSTWGGRR